jgi:serine/threonine protein kinase
MNGKPLFAGTCEIDQLSRIFELCGTPCENNWPEAAQLPGFFEFTHTPPKSFSKVFMGIPKVALDLLEKLLTLDPYKRLSASMVAFDLKSIIVHPFRVFRL